MNMHEPEDDFLKMAHAEFSASVAHLDAVIVARLRAARARAVEAVALHPPRRIARRWAMPAGALAAVFVAVVGGALWWGGAPTAPSAPFASSSNEDIPLVLTNDNLDMYADLDFYQWLAEQDQQSRQGGDDADNNNG